MSQFASGSNPFWRIPRSALASVIIGTLVIVSALIWLCGSPQPHLPSSVTLQDYDRAREAFEVKYGRAADHLDVLSWLAEWYLAHKRPQQAIDCFAEIPTGHSRYGRMARYQQGRLLFGMHRATEAEQQFRELISAEESAPSINPDYLVDARKRLRHILEVELRFEERHALLRGVIDRGEEDGFEAVAGCFPTMLRWNGPDAIIWATQFYEADPTSSWVQIAYGRFLTGQGKTDEARPILEAQVRQNPGNLWARAALIACLREGNEIEAAEEALKGLPPQSPEDPWVLLIQRGSFALQNGDPAGALAACEQVLAADRTSTEAWQGVAQAARILNDAPRRTKALEMVGALGRIQNHLGKTTQDPSNPNSFLDVADLCAEYKLIREGAVMVRHARRLAADDKRVRSTVARFRTWLTEEGQPPLLDQ